MNQSYNFAVNFTYINPNEPISMASFLSAYFGAVIVSGAVALKMNGLYEVVKDKLKEPLRTALRISTPYVAMASAGIFNLLITRL
jgi:hypothetical protein